MKPKQMSEGWWEPGLYSRPPVPRQTIYGAENVAKDEIVLYGPRGETILKREPRRVGFRPPN